MSIRVEEAGESLRWWGVRRMADGSWRIWRGRGFWRAGDAEGETGGEWASRVAVGDPLEGPDADPQTGSEAQTEVEAAQTAAAVAEGAVAVERQGRRVQAAWGDCPRRLHSFPRRPRPEHRRPLGWQSG